MLCQLVDHIKLLIRPRGIFLTYVTPRVILYDYINLNHPISIIFIDEKKHILINSVFDVSNTSIYLFFLFFFFFFLIKNFYLVVVRPNNDKK